jgi:4-oxalocrotonate tautomerase
MPARCDGTKREKAMPFINVRLAAPALEPDQIARIQQSVTLAMANILSKKAELTAVLVEHVPTGSWSVGGQPVAVAAHLDAKVTAGTNSTEEKARFINEAHKMLKDVLGPELPIATYVVVHEVPRDAWGYEGLTQAHRALSRAPAF